MTTYHHQQLRDIAALTVLQKRVADALAAKKAGLAADVGRGTLRALVDPTDPMSAEFGRFEIPTPIKPRPSIVDEDLVVPWALGEFGDVGIVVPRLSPQGRKSVLSAVERGAEVPGVDWSEPRAASPRWVPAKDADMAPLVAGLDLAALVGSDE